MAVNTKKEVRNLVIYQIFTRNYKEGTFKAIEQDLDRIKALGVDYIYLLPIQPSGEANRKGSMGSPYAIQDYRKIDPVQGSMDDFIQLTEAVHAKGMKIMIDVVYNHTSPDSWLAKNHPEWFYRKADGSFGNRVGEWWDVIDLDYSQPDLWNYQIDTLKMWAAYVDGFRCDVAPMVPLDFWKLAREAVEEVRPECLWLAESVEPEFIRFLRKNGIEASSDSELYQVFDILYDYDIYTDWKKLLNGECSLQDYLDLVVKQEAAYPDNYSKLRCLENHDRPRAAARFPEVNALASWTAWIFFAKGTTMLYAGQEACAEHHPTLFDPDPVDFDSTGDLSALISQLAEIKKGAIFAGGCFEAKAIGKNKDIIFAEWCFSEKHEKKNERWIGIFSTSGKKESLHIDLPDGSYRNAINGKCVDVFENIMICDGRPVIITLDA